MRTSAMLALVLVLAVRVPLAVGQDDAKPFAAAEWKAVGAGVATAVFGAPDARAKVRAQWGEKGWLTRPLTKPQAEQLAKLLALGNPFLTEKAGGSVVVPIGNGDGSEESNVLFKLPSGYSPSRPIGLVIAIHGGPQATMAGAVEAAKNEHSYFAAGADACGAALASPPIKATQADPTGSLVILGLVEAVAKRWNVDRNRVWIVGHSAGGVCSLMVGCPYADRLAGIGPFVCGWPLGDTLKNAYNLPVYHVLGLRDRAFLGAGRKNSALLRAVGGPLLVVEKDGGHDVYPDECKASLAWLAARPRRFWTPRVTWTPDPLRKASGFYWADAPPGAGAFDATVTAGKIELTGPVGRLWLADALVDLDKPIEVVRGGKPLFAGKLTRTLEVVLDWMDQRGDPQAVPTARVSLD